MKRFCTPLFLLMMNTCLSISVFAQLTAPKEVPLIYHLKKGDTLQYEHELQMTQYGTPGASGFSATVIIEDVNSNGDITMHISKSGKSTMTSYSSGTDGVRQQIVEDNESMRVIIDKYGNYRSCSDVIPPEYIIKMREEMRISGKSGRVIEDSSNVKSILTQIFPKRTTKAIQLGSYIIDTTIKYRKIVQYRIGDNSKSPATPNPPATFDTEVTIDSIYYSSDEMVNGVDCRKYIKHTNYTLSTLISGSTTHMISTILIRKQDGAIVSATSINDSSKQNDIRKNFQFEEILRLK